MIVIIIRLRYQSVFGVAGNWILHLIVEHKSKILVTSLILIILSLFFCIYFKLFPRVAVVTGANKGIGFEISKQLASNGVKVILTARDVKRGTEAVEILKAAGYSDLIFHQLDVSDPVSISAFVNFIKTEFGKLDILVPS